VYRVPQHAVKIWSKRDTDEANRQQLEKGAHEASILKMLSSSERAARWVPKFISHYEANAELHMELITGFAR
jgi:hypothetical protein